MYILKSYENLVAASLPAGERKVVKNMGFGV